MSGRGGERLTGRAWLAAQGLSLEGGRGKRRGKKPARNYPEGDHQKAAVAFLETLEARGLLTFHHPANERGQTCPECGTVLGDMMRIVLAALGVRPGVSDLVIMFRGGRAAYLELKAGSNTPTDNQRIWIDKVKALGGLADWSGDIDRTHAILDAWCLECTGEPAIPRRRRR